MQTKKRPTKEVIDNWKRQMQLQVELDKTVLKFLRHPDATPEQLLDLQVRYREAYKAHVEMRDRLRGLWPRSDQYWRSYPWEN